MTEKLRFSLKGYAKKALAWPMFWLTYGSGHFFFLICDSRIWPEDIQDGTWHDKLFSALYDCYQTGMRDSLFWNDFGDLKQWSEAS